MAAARWLDGMVEAGCLDFLVERICRRDGLHADAIAELLGSLGEAAVKAMHILRELQDGRWFVVRNMATILGDLGSEGTVEALGHHVKHPDRRVRREVVRAMAKIGGRQAARFLRECVTDADAVVRQAVIGYLGAARDSVALPPLMALAGERPRDKEGQDLRKTAIMALGQIGNRTAVPVLTHLVHKRSWFRRGEAEDVRIAAAAALGLLGGPEAVEALQRAKGSGGRVGEACEQALARLGA
jgi:HEAT repeat protein